LAREALDAFAPAAARSPAAAPTLLLALDEYLDALEGGAEADAEGEVEAEAAADAPPPAPAFSPGRLQLSDVPDAGATPPGRSVVAAEAVAPDEPVTPGEPFEVRVALTIAERYHLNANPAGQPFLIPTTIALAPDSPAELLGVDYPEGHPLTLPGLDGPISVYEGTVSPVARLRLPDDAAPGRIDVTLRLRYQACDDR